MIGLFYIYGEVRSVMLSIASNRLYVGNNTIPLGRYYNGKKKTTRQILQKQKRKIRSDFGIDSILIFVAFSIIKAIVSGTQNIESYFSEQTPLVQTAFISVWVGLCLLSVWIIIEVKNKRKAELIRLQIERDQEERRQILRKRNLEQLKKMCPFEFVEYIARVFRCAGFDSEVTKRTGDGGKDIILRSNGEVRLVECKRYTTTKVGRPDNQKFHSASLIAMQLKDSI